MAQCSFCGRYREGNDAPHPNSNSCPYEESHEVLQTSYPDATLFEAVKNTIPGDSVALRSWGTSYPLFKTVAETRMWLESSSASFNSGQGSSGKSMDAVWGKDIVTVAEQGTRYRIRYDPQSVALINWYKEEGDSEELQDGKFETFLRKESSDVSYFGTNLPD